MKFLFVANTHPNPAQGASGCDLQMIAALRDLGHEVDEVWTGGWSRRVAHHNLHQLLELPRWFAKVVEERCEAKVYDVVQVNQPHAWLAAKVFQEKRRPGIFINRSHGWETRAWESVKSHGEDGRSFVRRFATGLLRPFLARHNHLVTRYADGMVVETLGDRDAVIAEGGCRDVLVLPPGIPDHFLVALPASDSRRFRRVLHAASFSPHKAPEVVAAVMKRLARESDLELTWVAEESAHPAILTLLGETAGRVRLLGWVSPEKLRDLLDAHGFFLQPSYFEGFSLAFVQAMARGGIVFGSEIDCMLQTVKPGESGFLFSPGEVNLIVETLLTVAGDPVRCESVSREARRVAEGMTWRKAALDFQEFCRKVAEAKKQLP